MGGELYLFPFLFLHLPQFFRQHLRLDQEFLNFIQPLVPEPFIRDIDPEFRENILRRVGQSCGQEFFDFEDERRVLLHRILERLGNKQPARVGIDVEEIPDVAPVDPPVLRALRLLHGLSHVRGHVLLEKFADLFFRQVSFYAKGRVQLLLETVAGNLPED